MIRFILLFSSSTEKGATTGSCFQRGATRKRSI